MAHKKSGGSARNGRESNSKRLGCKAFSTQIVSSGAIIVRQRGTRFHPGENTNMGKDYTIFATMRGRVEFGTWHGKRRIVSVLPIEAQPASVLPIEAQPASVLHIAAQPAGVLPIAAQPATEPSAA